MAALGTTARLVQLSISAKIGMTSPAEQMHMLQTEPSPAPRNSCLGVTGGSSARWHGGDEQVTPSPLQPKFTLGARGRCSPGV